MADKGLAQDQFLSVVSRDEAIARFRAALDPRPLGEETVRLDDAVGRILAATIAAPVDAPPFDRSLVDGFAVRSADLLDATESDPALLALNEEVIACGVQPQLAVMAGSATPIATGGPLPRGADAVVMIEHTEPTEDGRIAITRAASPGQFVGYAGSDIARGETLLRAGTPIGAREVGMLATSGIGRVAVFRKPRVAVLSTGDELVEAGEALRPAAVYDANGPIVAAALLENGCIPVRLGALPDRADVLEAAIRSAHADHDAVVLSGGTSKGAGDLTHRIVAGLGDPGIVVHGVALKPGKPLLLAVAGGKPVVVLPGFPTSAMFTFHDIVLPVLRELAGLPPRGAASVRATVPVRIGSDLGRAEFVMVSLLKGRDGLLAYPLGKGSGAVTAFARADGFFAIPALDDQVAAGTDVTVTLLSESATPPDLAIIGSHCIGLDAVVGSLQAEKVSVRTVPVGSLGGLNALKRGECDVAPIHLLHPDTGRYNVDWLRADMTLVPGWRRLQGIVHRRGDPRFEGRSPEEAVAAAIGDPDCMMVNRNNGAGTRILIDRLLKSARPPGYWNQPRSHDAVAAAVVQGRADWGVAIEPVARHSGLGFIALGPEHYDFAVRTADLERPAVQAFLQALGSDDVLSVLSDLGFTRS